MPRGDKTGPEGKGPRTGRQMGYCSGNDSPGYTVSGRGLGRGFGRGFEKGFRRNSEINPRGEPRPRDGRGSRNFLRNSASFNYQNSEEILEKLGDIEKRLDNLEKE
ncbi:MAG TPA: DUF5320 domain-containing protein [Candidatus Nanoarchaeia archaeon]|nr:DUF5320 domain-containing protein [Candidatus Nanoarchaeia archaeon]